MHSVLSKIESAVCPRLASCRGCQRDSRHRLTCCGSEGAIASSSGQRIQVTDSITFCDRSTTAVLQDCKCDEALHLHLEILVGCLKCRTGDLQISKDLSRAPSRPFLN